MKYATVTFGCRVNQADTMSIERDLRTRGAVPSPVADADVVIVNSCSVTASADQGTRQSIRRVARDNPNARIVVTGCYATRCPSEVAALPGVVAVVPNHRKEMLADEWVTTADRFAGADGPCGAPQFLPTYENRKGPGPEFYLDRTALTLRVQTGCDEHCSYCIIPSTRGTSASRPAADIVGDLRRAEASGFLEVTLTGVHLGAYGRDLSPAGSLADLLEAAVHCTVGVTLRIGSLEPADVPDALGALAASGRLAPAFHLPLQHASDAVLARMRRPYTLDGYRRIVDRLREELPHAALGSDIIVGFPGESDDEFTGLCAYLESSPLTALHVFPYSDRPGTEASAMSGKIAPPVIKERGRIVREIGQQLSARFRASQEGSVRPALTIEDGRVAVTDNGIRVPVAGGHRRNERVMAAIPYGDRGIGA